MKKIIAVKVIKDLPGIPAGTELRKPKTESGCGFRNTWMTPACVNDEGSYLPSYGYLHFDEWMVIKFPEFFEVTFCCCCTCSCHSEGG